MNDDPDLKVLPFRKPDIDDETEVSDEIKELRRQAKEQRQHLIDEFNGRYCLVNDGGSVVVFSRRHDSVLDRWVYDRMHPGALNHLYANRKVCTRIGADRKRTYQGAAKFWFTHEKRRQFIHGVIFDPSANARMPEGVLNLWDGFGYKPKPGSWRKLREHVRTVVCQNNEEYFNYLMNWMARLVQLPAEMGEVAVVLRGKQGSGKGTLGHALRKLFGQHGMHISSSKHLVGNFNGHLRDCVFLFADEAFFAGDKASLSALKATITDPVLTIEGKYLNPIQCPNMLHILMASNHDWVVPAALDERRFFVLDVEDAHIKDRAYFDGIHKELKAGGYAAMLHELLNRDIKDFNVSEIPETTALQDQKQHTLDSAHAWWRDVLLRGFVFKSKCGCEDFFGSWHNTISTDILFDAYSEFARTDRHPLHRETFGKFLRNVGCEPVRPRGLSIVGEHRTRDGGEVVRREQVRCYRLGTLDKARNAFALATKLTIEWDEDSEEVDNPDPYE